MKLEHLVKGIEQTQARLKRADMVKEGLEESIARRLDESNKMLVGVLKELVAEQTNGALFSSSVHQTVLSITQNNQILLRALEKQTRNVVKEVESSNRNTIKEIEKVNKSVGSGNQALEGQINNLSKSVDRIPTQFPVQKETDLSGLSREIKSVGAAVSNIPTAKPADLRGVESKISSLETKLSKRVHVFEIERGKEGIKKVTVRTK